ncbi:MAG: hypothetical protein KGN00_06510 [Chloroflexota bacterium]|nr:hypothetical protein [Chloroflexota bacterium]
MKAVQDFNYKVALASGLKNLQAGKLRQAEEQFRYLVSKFPTADGGYRGLARVHLEKGDKGAAIATLRDGAASLSRSNERAIAIDLLREATTLDPLDLAAHRRLAAALALAGDSGAAAREYERFANAAVQAGDAERARGETRYAVETLGEIPALHALARSLGVTLRTVRVEVDAAGGDVSSGRPVPDTRSLLAEGSAVVEDADGRSLAGSGLPSNSPPAAPGSASPPFDVVPAEANAADVAEDPYVLEARAMALIGARDPEAGAVAIDATRKLIGVGKVQAASDLLLELVASGIAVHDAERELIGVASALGRDDIAAERQRLLEEATRLG